MKIKQINIEKYSLWKASRTDKIVIAVIFSFMTYTLLIQAYYEWSVSPPSKDEIYRTTGTLSLDGNKKSGYYPIITRENGETVYLSCRSRVGFRHLCLANEDEKTLKKSPKKNAEAAWFWQKTSPFSTQKRVLYLNAEGKKIIEKERTEKAINNSKKAWKFYISMYLIAIAAFYFGCRFILKRHHEYQIRINKEQQEKNDNE
jgi:hypothetical protein